MLVANVTALQTRNELTHWDNRPFSGAWSKVQRRMASGVTKPLRKKKRVRTSFTTQQLIALEEIFSNTKYIAAEYRKELAQSLQLEDKCIKIWFQNRRMKEKRDSSDSASELSSENSRSESSPSPVNCRENSNYEIIIKPKEETSVTENQVNSVGSSDYQITFNQQMYQNQNLTESCYYNNMYPTEYYPSYGSQYFSNLSMQYQNLNSECAINASGGNSWYADANNYFYCNN